MAAMATALLALGLFTVRLIHVFRHVNTEFARETTLLRQREMTVRLSLEVARLETEFHAIGTALNLIFSRSAISPDLSEKDLELELAKFLAAWPEMEGVFYLLAQPSPQKTRSGGLLRTPHGGILATNLDTVAPEVDPVVRLPANQLSLRATRRGTGEPMVLACQTISPPGSKTSAMVTVAWSRVGFNRLLAAIFAASPEQRSATAMVNEMGEVLGESANDAEAAAFLAEQRRQDREVPRPDAQAQPHSAMPTAIPFLRACHAIGGLDENGPRWRIEQSWFCPQPTPSGFLPGLGSTHLRAILVAGVATTALAMFLFLLALGMLTRHAFSPLRNALEFSHRLGRSDFSMNLRTRRRDEFGDLIRSLSFMRDHMQSSLTRLKQSHERERLSRRELETSDRLRSDFLSRMSSDLRTPLNSILAFAETLREEARAGRIPMDLRPQAETLHHHATQLHDLIASLLSLSKLESMRVEPKIAEVETSAFLRELLDRHQHAAETRNVSLQCEYSADLPAVINTDRELLINLLSALITNLIHLAAPGHAVTLGCTTGAHELAFSARGAPSRGTQKPLAELYNQYTRLDPDLMPHYGGQVILRLAIAKAHAQLLHADLTAETVEDNASLFRVIFRKSDVVFYAATETAAIHIATNWQQHLDSKGGDGKPDAGTAGERHTRILVAESDPADRTHIEGILREAEIEFDSVDNGKDCIETLHQRKYDLLLLDLAIPMVSAKRIVARLRAEPLFARLPIVITAKQIDAEERKTLQAAGVNEFLPNPIQIEDLIHTISALVE
jgi:signal transduction histidine kinase